MLPALLLSVSLARATDPVVDAPTSFALVVGSNRAGPGQQPLQFAIADAARIAGVLEEVGGVEASRLTVLEDPSADDLFASIDALAARIASTSGPTSLAFYYSGHARAGGLDLGSESIALEALRGRLEGLGATLTLVVLDACQSGAVSDVKGVEAAADFSTTSVGSLASAGIAIIASSTDTELSQESRAIGGSFFTLNLATGLRGPADENEDGNVTLAEAYQYAYHRTLVDTAATAVGAQHPTLETDLRGRGDLVLSRPSSASARLGFPSELSGDVLVVRARPEVVAAEVHKVAGERFELALTPGDYRAIVRAGSDAVECAFTLEEATLTPLSTEGCPAVRAAPVAAKGSEELIERRPAAAETFFVEGAAGALVTRNDGYTSRLDDFGFGGPLASELSPTWTLGVAWSPNRHLALTLSTGALEHRQLERETNVSLDSSFTDTFAWTAHDVVVGPRLQLPVLREHLVPYGQAAVGVAWTATSYVDVEGEDRQLFAGAALSFAGGLQEMVGSGSSRHFGFYQQISWIVAPALRDLIGDLHDDGGISANIGLRAGY
jgi:hypothetical protein